MNPVRLKVRTTVGGRPYDVDIAAEDVRRVEICFLSFLRGGPRTMRAICEHLVASGLTDTHHAKGLAVTVRKSLFARGRLVDNNFHETASPQVEFLTARGERHLDELLAKQGS